MDTVRKGVWLHSAALLPLPTSPPHIPRHLAERLHYGSLRDPGLGEGDKVTHTTRTTGVSLPLTQAFRNLCSIQALDWFTEARHNSLELVLKIILRVHFQVFLSSNLIRVVGSQCSQLRGVTLEKWRVLGRHLKSYIFFRAVKLEPSNIWKPLIWSLSCFMWWALVRQSAKPNYDRFLCSVHSHYT